MNTHDPGRFVVDHLRRDFQIEPEWLVEEGLGFTWWPYRHGQRIWAEPPYRDGDLDVSTVHVSLDIVRDIVDRDRVLDELLPLSAGFTLSAIEITDAGVLRLHAIMQVHVEIQDWAAKLLSYAALLQLREAEFLEHLADRGSWGVTEPMAHPESGVRAIPDETYLIADKGRIEGVPVSEPHPWLAADVIVAAHEWDEACGGRSFTAPMPWGIRALAQFRIGDQIEGGRRAYTDQGASWRIDEPGGVWQLARIDVDHSIDHWLRGAGLSVLLVLPVKADTRTIGELNRREATGESGTHVLGNWGRDKNTGGLMFTSFFPNPILQRGMAFNAMASNAVRARWAGQALR